MVDLIQRTLKLINSIHAKDRAEDGKPINEGVRKRGNHDAETMMRKQMFSVCGPGKNLLYDSSANVSSFVRRGISATIMNKDYIWH